MQDTWPIHTDGPTNVAHHHTARLTGADKSDARASGANERSELVARRTAIKSGGIPADTETELEITSSYE